MFVIRISFNLLRTCSSVNFAFIVEHTVCEFVDPLLALSLVFLLLYPISCCDLVVDFFSFLSFLPERKTWDVAVRGNCLWSLLLLFFVHESCTIEDPITINGYDIYNTVSPDYIGGVTPGAPEGGTDIGNELRDPHDGLGERIVARTPDLDSKYRFVDDQNKAS